MFTFLLNIRFLIEKRSENRIFKIQGYRTWISLKLTSSINEHDDFLIYITQITQFGGKQLKKDFFQCCFFLFFKSKLNFGLGVEHSRVDQWPH